MTIGEMQLEIIKASERIDVEKERIRFFERQIKEELYPQ